MSKKYSIGILIFLFLFIYLSIDNSTPEVTTQSQVVHAENTEAYYLFEVNGYIVVYLSDKKTPYEYTDILYDELPDLLKTEIRNGKYIENIEELYGFLENYTS